MDVLQQGRKPTARHPPGDAAVPIAVRPEWKMQHTCVGDKRPHGRPWIWLTAVIVICLVPVMDPIVADITMTALAIWAMAPNRR